MTRTVSERLERALGRVLAELPDEAYDIAVELPRSISREDVPVPEGVRATNRRVGGRDAVLYWGGAGNLDGLYIEWRSGHDHTYQESRLLRHVPYEGRVPESCEEAYHAIRRQGDHVSSSEQGARRYDSLSMDAREVYLRLLADGTGWDRAAEIAETL